MNIVVCVKQVVDTEAEKKLDPSTWRLDRTTVENILNPYDEYAVEAAIQLKERFGGEVTVLCMGAEAAGEAIRKALAMGGDKGVLITDPALAGSDTLATAYAIAQALKQMQFDLALFGIMSTDSQTGQVPAAVGDHLDLPTLTALNFLDVDGTTLKVHRQTDEGYIAYECPLPALVSVTKGINEPRYPSLKGIMGAKKKPLETKSCADLGIDTALVGTAGAKTKVLATSTPQARTAGAKIEDDGTGAVKIADFLFAEKIL